LARRLCSSTSPEVLDQSKALGYYLPFRPPLGRCESALPAAAFDVFEVRPSRRTFDAAFAALLLVTLLLLRAITITSFRRHK